MILSPYKMKSELSYDLKVRIFEWHREGKKNLEIANLLNISPQRVSYTLKTFDLSVKSNRKLKCGRKSLISPENDKFIMSKVKENRFISGRKLAVLLHDEKGVDVSPKSAKRVIQKYGLKACSSRKVPLLSKKNKDHRLKLARKYLSLPMSYWDSVIWSDETIIELYQTKGKFWVWRLPGEAYNPDCTKKTVKGGGAKIILWGCMSANGVGNLVEIKDTLTGPKYVKLLQQNPFVLAKNLGLEDGFVFQQDNDPKHTSAIADEFFEMNGIEMLEWPSQSPDLNVIEQMWSELKRRFGNLQSNSKSEMIIKLQEIWLELGHSYSRKLVNSVYDRFIEVIKNNGGSTRY